MVTFICHYCDVTLRKNQCQKHVNGRCRPAALICIDCSNTFHGNDYKQHTSCISEKQKHWGQFAKPKNKQPNHTTTLKEQNNQEQKPEKKQQKTQKIEQEAQNNWKGWKNQIKQIIKDHDNKIELQELKQKTYKRYLQQLGSKPEQSDQIFLQKVKKLKKIKLSTYVTLE